MFVLIFATNQTFCIWITVIHHIIALASLHFQLLGSRFYRPTCIFWLPTPWLIRSAYLLLLFLLLCLLLFNPFIFFSPFVCFIPCFCFDISSSLFLNGEPVNNNAPSHFLFRILATWLLGDGDNMLMASLTLWHWVADVTATTGTGSVWSLLQDVILTAAGVADDENAWSWQVMASAYT